MIDRARSASTTGSEVPSSANVVIRVLLELTSSGRSSDPGVPVHVRKQVLSGGDRRLPDYSTVADRQKSARDPSDGLAARREPGRSDLGRNAKPPTRGAPRDHAGHRPANKIADGVMPASSTKG